MNTTQTYQHRFIPLCDLEQTVTLWPFVGKFTALLFIAGMASYDKIVRAIRSTSDKGNDVINVIPCQFASAIVTFSLLSLILLLDIPRRMSPWRCSFASTTIAYIRSICVWLLIASYPTPMSVPPLVILIILACASQGMLFMFLVVEFSLGLSLLIILFGMCLSIGIHASFTPRSQATCLTLIRRKVIGCSRLLFTAMRTSFISIGDIVTRGFPLIRFLAGFSARFAEGGKAVALAAIRLEVSKRCGVGCQAPIAFLRGYIGGIIHDLAPTTSYVPTSFGLPGWVGTISSHWEATPMLGRHLSIPFFAAQQKAEMEVYYS